MRKEIKPLSNTGLAAHMRPALDKDQEIHLIHIAPTVCIPVVAKAYDGPFMALQHLCTPDSKYESYVGNLEAHVYIYLDNSAFELGSSCKLEDLVETGHRIRANCLIAPDGYTPNTIKTIRWGGFDAMAVPDGGNLLEETMSALDDSNVTFVGISFRHAVTWMRKLLAKETSISLEEIGIELEATSYTDNDPRARADFFKVLWWFADIPLKKIHMLGGTTPEEFMLMKEHSKLIYSWDSSMAVWCSLNKIALPEVTEKYAVPVDFTCKTQLGPLSTYNIGFLEGILALPKPKGIS